MTLECRVEGEEKTIIIHKNEAPLQTREGIEHSVNSQLEQRLLMTGQIDLQGAAILTAAERNSRVLQTAESTSANLDEKLLTKH